MNDEHRTSQMRDKASEIGKDVRDLGREAMGKASQATSQLKEKASDMGKNLREVGQEAGHYAKEKFGQMRESASEYYQETKRRAAEWRQSVQSYIQEQPVKAVLIASGIGVLVGLIWKRSRRAY